MTAVWMMLVLMTAARPTAQTLPVAIIAPLNVTDSLVRRICVEADGIWQPAGVVFDCHRIQSDQDANGWPLTVTIDDREARLEPDKALGWIPFTNGAPERSIFLSQANAEELVRLTPGLPNVTVLSHEILIGRALGRALAHEVGHYLLRSKVHTTHGLMRTGRAGDEFLALSRDGFELSPEQWSAAARSLQAIGLTAHVQDRKREPHVVDW
jgi:hypothetical protein